MFITYNNVYTIISNHIMPLEMPASLTLELVEELIKSDNEINYFFPALCDIPFVLRVFLKAKVNIML